jgi:hypothetical protein
LDPLIKSRMISLEYQRPFRQMFHPSCVGHTIDFPFVGMMGSQPTKTWRDIHHDPLQVATVRCEVGPEAEGEVVTGRLNLWRGWGVPPEAGDWSLMRQHLVEVIAAGNAEAAEYILNWLAWAVQHPAERAQRIRPALDPRRTGLDTSSFTLSSLEGDGGDGVGGVRGATGREQSGGERPARVWTEPTPTPSSIGRGAVEPRPTGLGQW